MTTPTVTKHLIKLPAAGKGVLLWIAADGQQVDTGQQIARFMVGNVEHRVDAPGTGQLTRTTPDNITLVGASVIGWVNEGVTGTAAAASQKPLQSPVRPAPVAEGKPSSKNAAPESRQQVQTVEPKTATTDPRPRRGSHIEAAALSAAVVELPSEPKERKGAKRRDKKTKNRTYSIGEHQEADIARLAKTLQLEALSDDSIPAVNESELIRAAVDMLLGLPRPALLDVLNANREREKAGKWGRGRPRPPKA
jgi:hypothetical protein